MVIYKKGGLFYVTPVLTTFNPVNGHFTYIVFIGDLPVSKFPAGIINECLDSFYLR